MVLMNFKRDFFFRQSLVGLCYSPKMENKEIPLLLLYYMEFEKFWIKLIEYFRVYILLIQIQESISGANKLCLGMPRTTR